MPTCSCCGSPIRATVTRSRPACGRTPQARALPVLGSGEGWVILGVDDGFDALLEQRGFEAEASSDQPFG